MEFTKKSNNQQLYEAVLNGNTEKITELLIKNEDIDISYKSPQAGCTSLAAAVKGRYCRIISLLLKQGADPNEIIDEGKSLLYIAAEAGHSSIVKLLLRAGATAQPTKNYDWARFGKFYMYVTVAQLLCGAGHGTVILEQFKKGQSVQPSYASIVKLMTTINTERESLKEVSELLLLFNRSKELLEELADIERVIQIARNRVNIEVQLNKAIQCSIYTDDYNMIAELGARLLDQEMYAAYCCLLEEDCGTVPVKYHTLLAQLTTVCKDLKDTQQFVFLRDFAALLSTLKAVDLTALKTALKVGILRPAIQLVKSLLLQQQLPVEEGKVKKVEFLVV